MYHVGEKFLNMMDVELEDLDAHIEALICDTLERWKQERITEHVCLSNLAVLRKEKHAVRHFEGIVTRMRARDISDVSELAAALTAVFREETARYDLSPAACSFAEHKIHRIEDYLHRTHWSDEKQVYLDSMSVR